MPVNVSLTNYNIDSAMSRHSLVQWINETLSSKCTKVEEMCSGVAYCQLMCMLFPDSIQIKKVKMEAKLEHEFIYNLKLFQNAFTKIKIEKNVPIEKLIKGRFQDNFEFLQWFKVFFDANYSAAPECDQLTSKPGSVKKNLVRSTSCPIIKVKPEPLVLKKDKSKDSLLSVQEDFDKSIISPGSFQSLTADIEKLSVEIEKVVLERDYYYKMLRKIELLCQAKELEDPENQLIQKVFQTISERNG